MPYTIHTAKAQIRDSSGFFRNIDVFSGDVEDAKIAALAEVAAAQTTALNAINTQKQDALNNIEDRANARITPDVTNDEVEAMLAPIFDTATAYAAGTYVRNADGSTNKLYCLTADHTAGATWADTSKAEVKIGSQITNLKSALDNGEIAVFGSCKSAAIRTSDYTIVGSSTATVYSFKVEPGTEYIIYFFGGNIRRVAYANSDFSIGLQLTSFYNKSGSVLLDDSTYAVNVTDYNYLYVQVTSNTTDTPGTVLLRKRISNILRHQANNSYNEHKIINNKVLVKESLILNKGSFTSSGIDITTNKYVYSNEIAPNAYIYNPDQYQIKIYAVSSEDHTVYDSVSFPYLSDEWIYLPGGNTHNYRLTIRKSDSGDVSVLMNIYLYREQSANLDIYTDEIKDTVEKVQKSTVSKSIVFGVLTDTHIDIDREKIYQNSEITLETMKRVNSGCHFDGILHLGDIIDGNSPMDVSIENGASYTEKLLSICPHLYYALGNHDSNFVIDGHHYEQISLAQNYAIYGRQNEKNVIRYGNNMYYYKDIGFMRLVVLNGYTAGISNDNSICRTTYDGERYGYNSNQIEWVQNQALNTTLPVLLICHFPITYEYLSESYRDDFKGNKILFNGDALRNVVQNFIDNGGTVLGLLHGHIHGSHVAKYQPDGFFEIALDASVFSARGTNSASDTPPGLMRYVRQWNTPSQESWNVCVVDDTNTLSLIRFGAGTDTIIHAEKVNLASTISMTSKLSGELTWSTSNSSIATVSDGAVTKVSAGTCDIKATDEDGNIEIWTVKST